MKLSTRFRNSQLRLLPQCGWAYREQYVLEKEGQWSRSLIGGRNVHAAVGLAIKEIVKGGPWLDVFQLAFKAVRGGDVEYADAIAILTRLTESLAEEDGIAIDPKAVFVLEETLEMPLQLSDGTEVVFFGTPDLVERTAKRRARVTDWKSHWRPEPMPEFQVDQQLDRYALLVNHHFPAFEEFHLVKRFVRYRNNIRERVITLQDLTTVRIRLVAEIEEARRREEAEDFEPTGGSWCGLCGFHSTCPLIAKYRELGADEISIPSDARASELAGASIALTAAAARLQEGLKRYLGSDHAKGEVPVSGGTYGYGPVTHRDAPYPEALRVFDEHGVQLPPEVVKIDLGELDRLRRRLPQDLVAAIDAITIVSESARCQFRRATPGASTPEPALASAGTPELW